MALCSFVGKFQFFYPEDGGRRSVRNVGSYPLYYIRVTYVVIYTTFGVETKYKMLTYYFRWEDNIKMDI
jgi:hypothetical protein